MANAQEVVVSGRLGELISAAYRYLVEDARISGIKRATLYQHRPEGFNTVPFAAVYNQNKVVAEEARSQIYWNPAVTPEMDLSSYVLERAIQFNEVDLAQPGIHSLNGIVMFRWAGDGGGLRKIRLAIVYGVADNGNIYQRDARILGDKFDHESEPDIAEK